jgi:hypothetical protein
MPSARQGSVEARHFPKTLNHAACRNHGQGRAALSSAINETGEQPEPSCVHVVYA